MIWDPELHTPTPLQWATFRLPTGNTRPPDPISHILQGNLQTPDQRNIRLA